MNARDEETIAAEKDLRDLLVSMINKPLMENLKSALTQHSFEVNHATSKAIAPIGSAISEIRSKQPEITDEVGEKLDEFCERALTAMAKCPTAVSSALSPGLSTLDDQQRALGETQRAIGSVLETLRTSVDESVAKHAERLTEISTQLNQLERAGVDLMQRTCGQFEQLETNQREYRNTSDNRMNAIEAALTSADLQRRALKKLSYGGLALSASILLALSVDVVVRLVH
jgi:chromosome segregation ATPase